MGGNYGDLRKVRNFSALDYLPNPGFEENFEATWRVSGFAGGEGTGSVVTDVRRTGQNAVKLSKTNAYGYLQLSTKEPVLVEAGSTYTFRFWFNSSNAQITSFLIPRIVIDNDSKAIVNSKSALWIDFDYDSQSLMRNSATTQREDWIKRVVFYTNDTEEPQEVHLQMMLYGNPFEVYIDDVEFFYGKVAGTRTPANPVFHHTEAEVRDIVEQRGEEVSFITTQDNVSHYTVNGQKKWPVFYRALPGQYNPNAFGIQPEAAQNDYGFQDPAGFAQHGVDINNVVVMEDYWAGKNTYDWEALEKNLMQILRKNPNAKLFLDFSMDPYAGWVDEHPNETWQTKQGKALGEASYASKKWREDGAEAIRHLIADMKTHGYWKLVVGCTVVGGHDWQFWTKVIGEFAADYSPTSVNAWQTYLRKQYGTINGLNQAWGTEHADFAEIAIPDPPTRHEEHAAVMPRGPLPELRQFSEANAFDLRETFARVIKEEAGKKLPVGTYGMPMENQHAYYLNMARPGEKANDMITSMAFYPYRQPGFASGYHPEQSFGYHGTQFIQELDLRSYASDMAWYDELALMWCSSQPTFEDWRNMHRKLVGISLAQNQGYWYYDMDKQFVDEKILDEVGTVKKIADTLALRKGVPFRPDVCLVRFGAESRHYGTSVDNAVGATNQWQYMLLGTSGVPYDVHYLSDLRRENSLQGYKIYIFHNNTYLSDVERTWIDQHLKKDNNVLVWLYDSGYATEQGLSTDALSELVGMEVSTETDYQRATVAMSSNDPLTGQGQGYATVPTFQGMAEALCGIFTSSGPASICEPLISKFGYLAIPGVSRYQKFWVDSGYDQALGRYREDDQVAVAVKQHPTWTSVYVGAPNALAGEMLNNLAQQAGAYRCGPPAMGETRMSGRFVSYHALRSGAYEFQLPAGVTKVTEAETGAVQTLQNDRFTIDGIAQRTYWYFLE
jgi:hypothetical protein